MQSLNKGCHLLALPCPLLCASRAILSLKRRQQRGPCRRDSRKNEGYARRCRTEDSVKLALRGSEMSARPSWCPRLYAETVSNHRQNASNSHLISSKGHNSTGALALRSMRGAARGRKDKREVLMSHPWIQVQGVSSQGCAVRFGKRARTGSGQSFLGDDGGVMRPASFLSRNQVSEIFSARTPDTISAGSKAKGERVPCNACPSTSSRCILGRSATRRACSKRCQRAFQTGKRAGCKW